MIESIVGYDSVGRKRWRVSQGITVSEEYAECWRYTNRSVGEI